MRKPSILSALKALAKRDTGNVTIITALSAIPLVAAVGAAVDYANISRDLTSFQAAIDTALVAVVSSDKASISGLSGDALAARMAELKGKALDYMEKNYQADFVQSVEDTLELAIDGQKVTITATHQLPITWMHMFGILEPTVTITSEVKKAARPIELVMVMDTTGSMGTTFMDQAKTASRNLLTKLYGGSATAAPENENIRVGLVPFSGAVRLNTSAYDFDLDWIDTTGAATMSKLNFTSTSFHNYQAWSNLRNSSTGAAIPWNGCVEARWGNYKTDDTPPGSGNTLFTPYFAPDEPTFNNSTGSSYRLSHSYIGTSGTPNENTGLSSTTVNADGTNPPTRPYPTTAQQMERQENQAKYGTSSAKRSISPESSSPSSGPWANCAASSIVPLTYNRSRVESGINAMTARGPTVIPEGLAWGWRVLSPTEPFTKVEAGPSQPAGTISPYNDARWQKILVLMTDGENDVLSSGNEVNSLNGTWYSAYGRGKEAIANNRFGTTSSSAANGALNTAMLTLCSNIKAQNITIYTVAFRVSSSTILNNLKNCATSEAHYSYAADGVALAQIFNHIGENVLNTAIYISK
jgi:Flp pilus assembly protein TadG